MTNWTSDLSIVAIDNAKWKELKQKTPYGQLPVLRHGDIKLAQSVAIMQYVASQLNLASYSDAANARMLSVALAVEDAAAAVRPHKATRHRDGVLEELGKWVKTLEGVLTATEDKKHFAEGKLTWADVAVYDFLEQTLVDFLKIDPDVTLRETMAAPHLSELFATVAKAAKGLRTSDE